MKKTILIKENNETKKVIVTSMKELSKLCSKKPHLCMNCSNADAINCEKIKRPFPRKLEISKYPFIKEGYQIRNEYSLEKFIVSECDNYKKFSKKKWTEEERNPLTENLITSYFGVDTPEEARDIMQHDFLINRKIRKKSK